MDSKSMWQSKTVYAVLLAIALPILKQFHVTIGNDDLNAIAEALAAAVGGGLAIYGRIKATQPLHVIAPAPPEQPKV